MASYSEFRKKISLNETTVLETVQNFLDSILSQKNLNAFLTMNAENALISAQESDKRFAEGTARSLEGMVVALKDNLSTKGIRTTCASKILENFIPVYDATVVELLKNAGAIIIGKTNLDEFAMGSSNENSAFGGVEHPFNAEYIPGGSSGGSTVAVAAELAHCALGSDTGGSIRQPAALCGVVGLKPTYGRISRYGLVAFASSLDQIGTLTNSVEDTAHLLDAITGKDSHDTTSANLPPTNTVATLKNDLPKEFTVAVLPDDQLDGCNPDVLAAYRKSVEKMKELGGKIIERRMENVEAFIPTYYILATAEASANLARFDGVRYGFRAKEEEGKDLMTLSRSQGFGAEVKRRIMLGTYVLSSGYYDAYYLKAQKVRRLIDNFYRALFADADVFLLPTTPTPAFKKGEKANDPIAMYLSDIFTVSANLAGNPAISIPAGKSADGLPIGVQLQTKNFAENELLQFAWHLEQKLAE